MCKTRGIIVFGANGSGKTTVGRELARILKYKHMDIEDYCFKKSRIPYTAERPREECINLMLADIEKHRSFVLSAVTGEFSEAVESFYKLGVYILTPFELRMKRLEQRIYDQHGERIRKGGDMYEQHVKFIEFAASRSAERIERWAKTLACPIIRIDGRLDSRVNAANIAERFMSLRG